MIGEGLYPHLPIFAQNLACSAYGWRERRARTGPHFWSRFDWLRESEHWSREQLDQYQDEQVAKLARHVYAHVPHYRRVFDELGLSSSQVTSRADLHKLPILGKEVLLARSQELIARGGCAERLRKVSTSGTTGTALQFFTTTSAISFQWAVWWRHRARFGVMPFQWHINFTGKHVVPVGQRRPPFWRWNVPMRQAIVSMQHVTREKVPAIKKMADSRSFVYYSGYPSIVAAFCEELLGAQLALEHPPSCVFLGAEGIQENQRQVISAATGARITDQYGFSEGCGNASQCEFGFYHEDSEFGVLECADGELLEEGRVRGKIVATGFANNAFPFIRYEVGDYAIWMPDSFKCQCGRRSRVIEHIEGRSEDYVITPEGTKIMRFDYVFKGTHGIREAQVVQRELGSVVIRVVPRAKFSKSDQEMIVSQIRKFVSVTIEVEFEVVSEIPKGANGKFRPVLSELSRTTTAINPPATKAQRAGAII